MLSGLSVGLGIGGLRACNTLLPEETCGVEGSGVEDREVWVLKVWGVEFRSLAPKHLELIEGMYKFEYKLLLVSKGHRHVEVEF